MSRRGWLALVGAILVIVPTAWFFLDARLSGVSARLDRNASGVLERDEVGPVVARHFDEVDVDGSGAIDGVEFRRWILHQWWAGRTRPVAVPALPAAPDAEALRRWIDAPVASGALDGVAVLVLKDGKVVFRHAAGNIDPSTAVPLASASKWLTAATFACLQDRKALDLSAPVDAVGLDLPARWSLVTLDQMLSHTAGTPADQVLSLAPDTTTRVAGMRLADRFPPEDPGKQFRYGGVSMQVAGMVAERTLGKRWRRLFVECLSWPLSLHSARWGHPLAGPSSKGLANLGAGLFMSLDDYGTFLSMLQQDGRYDGVANLSPAAVAGMFRDRAGDLPRDDLPPTADPDWGYALGAWCERKDAQGNCRRLNSAGAFGAFPWLDRDTHLAGIILTVDSMQRVRDWTLATRALVNRVYADAGTATGPDADAGGGPPGAAAPVPVPEPASTPSGQAPAG